MGYLQVLCIGLCTVALLVLLCIHDTYKDVHTTEDMKAEERKQMSTPPTPTPLTREQQKALLLKPRYVTMYLQGGLGNQLFQVAAGYAYAKTHQLTLVFDKIHTTTTFTTGIPRPTYFEDTFSWTHHIPNMQSLPWKDLSEESFAYQPLPFEDALVPVRFRGYFQAEAYFRPYAEELKTLFLQNYQTPDWPAFQEAENTVSVHVRRGDYVNNPYHPTQSWEYYQGALQYIKQQRGVSQVTLVVFSDDIHYCEAHFPSLFPLEQVLYVPASFSEETSVKLMGETRDHILVNSSFSWWGAYLSRYDDAITCVPTRWFGDEQVDVSDLYCSNWTKFDPSGKRQE